MNALDGIVILDMTRVYSGPFSTMLMADMGAEVIKIEIPGKGDDTRGYGPFVNGESLYYANVNRNKKGVTLNVKPAEGKAMFLELVKKADIVVENFRPGVMAHLELDYERLSEINPAIIMGSISAFGQSGEYSTRPGYDIISQAMGGLMSITGYPDNEPTRSGNAIGDVLSGISLTVGLLAALHARSITGRGQHVDVALADSVIMSLENATMRYFATGKEPERMGNRYAAVSPYDSFKASDGYFVLGCANQKLYEAFCRDAIKRPGLISDARFTDIPHRLQNQAELHEIIQSWAAGFTVEEIVGLILAAGVPAAPVFTIGQVVNNRYYNEERNMFPTVHHPVIGEMHVNGCHIKMSDTMPAVRSCAPALGEHNVAVYGEMLGISAKELEGLKERGVI